MRYVRSILRKIFTSLAIFFLLFNSACGFFRPDDSEPEAEKPPPFVFAVTPTIVDGVYGIGQAIPILVKMTEPVTVEGTPQLTLETGDTDAIATYQSGSTTAELVFLYTVQGGENSLALDYVDKSSFSLNGGKIFGGTGLNAVLGLVDPGTQRSLSYGREVVIDTTSPTVVSLTSTLTNGTYGPGQVIPVTITFSEVVSVEGTPQLTLETGSTDAVADYVSGSGTTELLFQFTVSAGMNSSDLDIQGTGALALNGGTILDGALNVADLTLLNPGAAGTLGANKAIVVDTISPFVTGVNSTLASGSYKVGQLVPITVTFNEAVTVSGTPQLTLETGGTDRVIDYASGSGSSVLTFNYIVSSGDTSLDLDYVSTSALSANGGTIRDDILNDAALTLASPAAAGSLGANKDIVIDTTAPTVAGVTSIESNGTFKIGDTIDVTVTFSETVTVTGTPQLTLETGSSDAVVNYSSGTGTSTLRFTFTVAAGHASGDLDYGGTSALATNGGGIKDTAGNDAVLTLANPAAAGSLGANRNLVIDGVAPRVTNVTSAKTNGRYTAGELIDITVTFDDTVLVTGTPTLTLETGSSDPAVAYTGGTGTNTLTFSYTVAAGQDSSDLDYVATTSLSGTIKDASGNSAVLTLAGPGAAGSLGVNRDLIIDNTAPSVTSVSASNASGSYKAGQVIGITVTYSEAVTVTGVPLLTLETGGTDAVVSYSGGTGTATLSFDYLIGAAENASDLDYVSATPLNLNGGTIKDAVSIDASSSFPSPAASGSLGANKNIVVDTIDPTVSGVSSSTSSALKGIGNIISIQVTFSESVTVTGTPQLTLETGASDRIVNYSGGSGSAVLTFDYTVGANDQSADLDYQSTAALALNSGTIKDLAGNIAVLTLANMGAAGSLGANKDFVIDGIVPTVSNVTATNSNGTYGAGQSLTITVTFSEIVTVTGAPQMTLETGSSDAVITYSGGTGSTLLSFAYVIGAGEAASDLDYESTSALSANGGTIRDAAGNTATLTLASPLAAGSLGANKDLVIRAPGTSVTKTGTTNSGQFGFSVAVVGDVDGDGYSDYAVAEPYADAGGTARGQVIIYSGADDSTLYTLSKTENSSAFGFSVAAAGDINRDGHGDIIIGQPLAAGGGTNRGKAYVYSGASGAVLYTITGSENNAQLGYSVSGAGDVNRDGKPDFIIGEPYADASGTDRGKAYIYNGANGSVVLRTITGTEDNALLGYSVAAGGDVNRDGKTDVIIGEPLAAAGGTARGKVYVYGVSGAAIYAVAGGEDNAHFGSAVAGPGDVNGDGKTDFLVGEPLANDTGTDRGKAYVMSGATGNAFLTITGAEDGARLGSAVAAAGDVNRDGSPDFIVGEPFADNGGSDRGKAYVLSGADGSVFYTLAGSESGSTFGAAVAGGGDFNKDGKSDFIVGIPLSDSAGSDRGAATRFTSGYTTLPSGAASTQYSITGAEVGAKLGSSIAHLGDVNGDGRDDFLVAEPKAGNDQGAVYVYSGASGAVLYTLTGGAEAGAQFGYSAAGLGDVSGDGMNDIIAGEPFANSEGKVYVYHGSNGTLKYTLTGTESGGQFGTSVAIVGDLNGDGKDDFAVSEPAAGNGGTNRGIAYVISGVDGTTALCTIGGTVDGEFLGDKVAAAGDVNGDGKPDFIVATSKNGDGGANAGKFVVYNGSTCDPLYSVVGAEVGARLGFSVAGIGDVNGDGKDDFAAGAPLAAGGGTSRGEVIVYSGATGNALYSTVGGSNSDELGYSVNGAGDVNGDGRADFVMGAPFVNGSGTARGRVYVNSGRTNSTLYSFSGSDDGAHLGTSVGGGGDVDRDGKADVLGGEPEADNGASVDVGKGYYFKSPSN